MTNPKYKTVLEAYNAGDMQEAYLMVCSGYEITDEVMREEIRLRVEGMISTIEAFKKETDLGMLLNMFEEPEWRKKRHGWK